MDNDFIKVIVLALCAVILINIVKSFKPELGIYVVIACSVLILFFLMDSLKTAFAYMADLYGHIENGRGYFPIIIKILIIAYVSDFTAQLCKDSGEGSIATKVEFCGKVIIFCVSIPIFISVFQLVEELL